MAKAAVVEVAAAAAAGTVPILVTHSSTWTSHPPVPGLATQRQANEEDDDEARMLAWLD